MLSRTQNVTTYENDKRTIKLECKRVGVVTKNDKVNWNTYFTIDCDNSGELYNMSEKDLLELYNLITEYYQGNKKA